MSRARAVGSNQLLPALTRVTSWRSAGADRMGRSAADAGVLPQGGRLNHRTWWLSAPGADPTISQPSRPSSATTSRQGPAIGRDDAIETQAAGSSRS